MNQQHTQEGKLANSGFLITARSSTCWSCRSPVHKRKPGAKNDIWRCDDCEVEWETPTQGA